MNERVASAVAYVLTLSVVATLGHVPGDPIEPLGPVAIGGFMLMAWSAWRGSMTAAGLCAGFHWALALAFAPVLLDPGVAVPVRSAMAVSSVVASILVLRMFEASKDRDVASAETSESLSHPARYGFAHPYIPSDVRRDRR
jgi:hypothetical protein